jgi:TrkA domain protein
MKLTAHVSKTARPGVGSRYGLTTGHIPLTKRSPYAGRLLADPRTRTRTGASIAAVLQRTGGAPSPAPDFRFAIGDTLVVVGSRDGLDTVAELITGG